MHEEKKSVCPIKFLYHDMPNFSYFGRSKIKGSFQMNHSLEPNVTEVKLENDTSCGAFPIVASSGILIFHFGNQSYFCRHTFLIQLPIIFPS